MNVGSPPQVRGKLLTLADDFRLFGITPAGAGKTFRAVVTSVAGWDHPRRCGENCRCQQRLTGCLGSPPQVRGKHCKICPFGEGGRITPAGAGKTIMAKVTKI